MDAYAELEIGLYPSGNGTFQVDLRFSQPGSGTEMRPAAGQELSAQFDFAALNLLAGEPRAYGARLSEQLFADPRAMMAFVQARTAARSVKQPLRVKLYLAPGAESLNQINWEVMADPYDHSLLTTQDAVVFSRVVSSDHPAALPERGELRALLAVANPSDLGDYGLAPLDGNDLARRVQAELGEIALSRTSGPLRLESLLDALHKESASGGYDILYLACHGRQAQGEYTLYLEDGQGKTNPTAGEELLEALQGMAKPPRLVVLAACESAMADPDGVLFAARAAQAGIPAVLGMQMKVSLGTLGGFMPVFFRELAADGQVDRAAAAARQAVMDRPDFWAPVLLMSLRSGRIWKEEDKESQAGKYNVQVNESSGTVIGDGANVTMNFGEQPKGGGWLRGIFKK